MTEPTKNAAKEAPKPAAAILPKDAPKAEAKATGPYDSISVGDLQPGETGWLSLSDTGEPDAVYRFPPEEGANVFTCPVLTHDPALGTDKITTITGASLSANMQPSSEKRFIPRPPEGAPVVAKETVGVGGSAPKK